jgi:hypothetical protein
MLIFTVVSVVVVLLVGMTIGAVVRGYLLLPSDRRRLGELANQLYAEARIDAATRATAQAMRDTVRQQRAGRR